MISCATTRGHMLDVARRTASDAVRLEVESHLETCAACREERATWMLVESLRDPPRLPAAAQRRVLSRLIGARGPVVSPVAATAARGRRAWRLALPLAAVTAAGALFAVRARVAPVAAVVEGQTLEAAAPGLIAFGGAGVSYRPGTALTFHPATRTLDVARGEVDVDVKEGLPGRFRVTTPRFVVEVLGTRFVVNSEGVRTLRGRVRVLDRQGHELAVLHAGDAWRGQGLDVPPVAQPAPESATVPVVEPLPVVPAPAPVARVAPPARRATVSELLARGRAALAAGDAHAARGFIDRALAAGPSDAEAPAAELLQADALLVDRRPDDAVAAYRRVARRRARAPEGETAAFAVGQLLFERGAEAEAGAALYDYLARYPHGRFVREARERLAQIQSAR